MTELDYPKAIHLALLIALVGGAAACERLGCAPPARQAGPDPSLTASRAAPGTRAAPPPGSGSADAAAAAPTAATAQGDEAHPAESAAEGARSAAERLQVDWDPATGRGQVIHFLRGGDLLRTCFHCDYPGYTGGLIIGGYNGSGMGFYPRQPIAGHRAINVLCAQDESIWDHRARVEYTYGWSENFGRGDDGRRLSYTRGRVLAAGPDKVILQSENVGGCYRVTKVAATRRGVRWWILATRITNTCDHAVRFDFFTGDDPWIGRYRSSDGDVGWTQDGLVRNERALAAGQLTAGGLYDLGNSALGQKEGSFTNQANVFLLDPAIPLPDHALFANSFAHAPRDIDPDRPLDNKSLTALNLGWVNRTLAPNEGFTVAMAVGLAHTSAPGTTPRAPRLTAKDWSLWRPHLNESRAPRVPTRVEFAAEHVDLTLRPEALEVTGTYYARNTGGSAASVRITYPILLDEDGPAPASVTVDGARLPVETVSPTLAQAVFPIAVPAHGLSRFEVSYRQPHSGRKAAYMVTSARRWPGTMTRATFRVRYPRRLSGRMKLSYPASYQRAAGDWIEAHITRQPFVPDRELTLRW